jgi:hypothetical protein
VDANVDIFDLQVILADFGMAKKLEKIENYLAKSIGGTILFYSPEMAFGLNN